MDLLMDLYGIYPPTAKSNPNIHLPAPTAHSSLWLTLASGESTLATCDPQPGLWEDRAWSLGVIVEAQPQKSIPG